MLNTDHDYILKLWGYGLPTPIICKRVRLTSPTINRIIRSYGFEPNKIRSKVIGKTIESDGVRIGHSISKFHSGIRRRP